MAMIIIGHPTNEMGLERGENRSRSKTEKDLVQHEAHELYDINAYSVRANE